MAACPKAPGRSFLVPPLHARLPQQLAMLLLGHSLAALLDDGAHYTTSLDDLQTGRHACARPTPAGWAHAPTFLHANGQGYRPGRMSSARGSRRGEGGRTACELARR